MHHPRPSSWQPAAIEGGSRSRVVLEALAKSRSNLRSAIEILQKFDFLKLL